MLESQDDPLVYIYTLCFQAGREGREKYGRKQQRMNPHASTTNKEKRKNKPFMMMKQKHGIKHKQKRSFREKQVCERYYNQLHPLLAKSFTTFWQLKLVTSKLLQKLLHGLLE